MATELEGALVAGSPKKTFYAASLREELDLQTDSKTDLNKLNYRPTNRRTERRTTDNKKEICH